MNIQLNSDICSIIMTMQHTIDQTKNVGIESNRIQFVVLAQMRCNLTEQKTYTFNATKLAGV